MNAEEKNELGHMLQRPQFEVESFQSVFKENVISLGRGFYGEFRKAEFKWKLYVLYVMREVALKFRIEDEDTLKFLIRFVASSMNTDHYYFLNEDWIIPIRKPFMQFFQLISQSVQYFGNAPNTTRTRLVRDILKFYYHFGQASWSEIESTSNGHTWVSWKQFCFSQQSRKPVIALEC